LGAFKTGPLAGFQTPLFFGVRVSVVRLLNSDVIKYHLRRVNRHLLDAIETPPDTGQEHRLDAMAARLWASQDENCHYHPDPGLLCRIDRKLATLQRETTARRAEHIEQARSSLRSCQVSMDAAV
jgi:hypothetical protein